MKFKHMVSLAAALALAAFVPVFAAEDGKALFDSKCAMCHGSDGVAKKMGTGSKNFNDAEWKKTATADGIIKITKEGKGKMKGLGEKLNDAQMKAVADYVLTLAK